MLWCSRYSPKPVGRKAKTSRPPRKVPFLVLLPCRHCHQILIKISSAPSPRQQTLLTSAQSLLLGLLWFLGAACCFSLTPAGYATPRPAETLDPAGCRDRFKMDAQEFRAEISSDRAAFQSEWLGPAPAAIYYFVLVNAQHTNRNSSYILQTDRYTVPYLQVHCRFGSNV